MVTCGVHLELPRAVRALRVVDGTINRMVEVPGWYPDDDSNSIHSGQGRSRKQLIRAGWRPMSHHLAAECRLMCTRKGAYD